MTAPITIVVAEDDEDDRLLIGDAFNEIGLSARARFVNDGEELLDYLHRRGPYEELKGEPYPGLVLLDLNMPRKDGATALEEIRRDPDLRHIPVMILSTTKSDQVIGHLYSLGANSFMTKRSTFEGLCDAMRVVERYWGEIVAVSPLCRG